MKSPSMRGTKALSFIIISTTIGLVVLLAGVKFLLVKKAIAEHSNFELPPTGVTTISAKTENWPSTLSAVGSLAPLQGVTLSAEVAGKVSQILFESGSKVKAGEALVMLDTTVEEADLHAAEAISELARARYNRAVELRKKNANSVDDLNNAAAELKNYEAQTNSLRAVISRKRVIAPFAGTAGIRMVNVGDYLNPGSPVVPLTNTEKLYVNISLPQQELEKIAVGQPMQVTTDAFPGEVFTGTLTAIDSHVHEQLRSIALQGTIDNPSGKLLPGMFVQALILLPDTPRFVTVPSSSVTFAPYGNSVYIVEKMKNPKGRDILGVRQQIVRVGPQRGDQIAVIEGIKEGEEVVSSGTFKLMPGAEVVVDNNKQPNNSPNPHPENS